MLFGLWEVSQWPIVNVEPRDRWGFTRQDPRCELDTGTDYARTHLPEECSAEVAAMQYAQVWNMSPDAVLDMLAVVFLRRVMIHKATTLRKPEYTEHGYHLHRSGMKLSDIPKRRIAR